MAKQRPSGVHKKRPLFEGVAGKPDPKRKFGFYSVSPLAPFARLRAVVKIGKQPSVTQFEIMLKTTSDADL